MKFVALIGGLFQAIAGDPVINADDAVAWATEEVRRTGRTVVAFPEGEGLSEHSGDSDLAVVSVDHDSSDWSIGRVMMGGGIELKAAMSVLVHQEQGSIYSLDLNTVGDAKLAGRIYGYEGYLAAAVHFVDENYCKSFDWYAVVGGKGNETWTFLAHCPASEMNESWG